MLRWSPEPEAEAAARPASAKAPPYPRPPPRGPASLARAPLTGCLGEVSCELIGRVVDQWERAAAPGAGGWQSGREETVPNQQVSRWAWRAWLQGSQARSKVVSDSPSPQFAYVRAPQRARALG